MRQPHVADNELAPAAHLAVERVTPMCHSGVEPFPRVSKVLVIVKTVFRILGVLLVAVTPLVADEPLGSNNHSIISPLQTEYEILRNDSNQPLKRASVVIGLTVVNRIVSAIHASSYAKLKNQSMDRRVRFEWSPTSPGGGHGLTASVAASF